MQKKYRKHKTKENEIKYTLDSQTFLLKDIPLFLVGLATLLIHFKLELFVRVDSRDLEFALLCLLGKKKNERDCFLPMGTQL